MRRESPDVRRAHELLGPDLFEATRVDPEAVIALLEPMATPERQARLKEVIARRLDSVTLLMDAPHDPHNGAAVVRSCDAFGLQRLHVIERREPFLAATTVAKGSEKWVDVIVHATADQAIAHLEASGHELIAADPRGDLAPEDLRRVPRLAIVVGNEHGGIADDLRSRCKRAVRVVQRGFVESLNLSVSAGILLSFAASDRAGDLPTGERRRLYARGLVLTIPRAAEVLFGRRSDRTRTPDRGP
jgi:tRNA (guanosine-2'-O-)-methyltransferase